MNTNRKIPKLAMLILASTQLISNSSQVFDNKSKEKIEWDKIDDED